tara:strand:- start:1044 stop:2069 length:1026 start_codon:yes stop_codon:yes gene_type:complete
MKFIRAFSAVKLTTILGTLGLFGCQTTDLPDPNYTWTMSGPTAGNFNMPAASNVPVSSVSRGLRNPNFSKGAERWSFNCNAGDAVIEYLPFNIYSRQDFDAIRDKDVFLRRFEKRLPSPNSDYDINEINITERLASGHVASYRNIDGEMCQHSLVIMRSRSERLDAWDSGFVDTVVDIDYCGEPQLDIPRMIAELHLYKASKDSPQSRTDWKPEECAPISKSFEFSGPLDTTSFTLMTLNWKKALPTEDITVEFRSNKREGVFTFFKDERVKCSGTYKSATDFPVVQGEWSVSCDDNSTAIGKFVTHKDGQIWGIGYDANGNVARFSFGRFVLDRDELKTI